MRRFIGNRWLAFILTLSVLLASFTALSSPSYGEGRDPVAIGDPSGGMSPAGDPDSPSGPGKRNPSTGRVISPGNDGVVAPVVGRGTSLSVWSWRVKVVLQSLISRSSRF